MKKLIVAILVVATLFAQSGSVQASPIEAGASASLSASKEATVSARATLERIRKKETMRRILERRSSPLALHIDDFLAACDKYELDCYLLPSITGLESSFGVHIASGTYNPFGWGGGYITFKDWGEAIDTVGSGLRYNYINKGAGSIEDIGAIYAASPTWAVRVRSFMAEFEAEEAKSPLSLGTVDIQL